MSKYKLNFDAESDNDYENAKKHLLRAKFYINKLTNVQQQMLAKEIFGIEKYNLALKIMQRLFIMR